MDTSHERARAVDASNKASEIAKRLSQGGTKFCTEYRSYTDALPALILQSGLGQALATELAAGGKRSANPTAHHLLYDHLESWLCSGSGVFTGSDDAIQSIITGTEEQYIEAQAEALAWLTWHKKFCRALLPNSEGDAGDQQGG